MDVELRTYLLHDDGSLETLAIVPFESYGECPNVGDTICEWFDHVDMDKSYYSVQRRYFVHRIGKNSGWAVVLRKIDVSEPIGKLVDAWEADDEFWGEVNAIEVAENEAGLKPLAVNTLEGAKVRLAKAKNSAPKAKSTSKVRKASPKKPKYR
jgi:hypothetical protein